MTAPRWRRLLDSRWAPVALVALFAALVVLTIDRFSIWIDESATLELVNTNGYADIVRKTSVDVHPPLWYLVLKPWLDLFGATAVAARAQQALFMLGALGVWYRLLATRFSRDLALLALLLMVVDPFLLHYAVEGRMYGFGMLLTGVTCLLITGTWRWRWVAYWCCAVAMLYTHYFLAFVLAAQFVYLVLRRREQGRSLVWLVLFGASIVAAFVPWLPHATHGTTRAVARGFWIPPVSPNTVTSYALETFLHRLDHELQGARIFPALLYLGILAAMVVRAVRARGGPYALLWSLAGVPWVFLLVLSSGPFVPVFHPRYVIFGLPALIALIAAGVLTLQGRWRALALAVLVAGGISGIVNLRWRGFAEIPGYFAMDDIAAEIAAPIGGVMPTVVAADLFPFFDAHATLGDKQRVVFLRNRKPSPDEFPDALYWDRPGWYVLSLNHVHARHVWLLEAADKPPLDVPPTWRLQATHVHGYARNRLFTLDPP